VRRKAHRQPARLAWQAACLLGRNAPRHQAERAVRETFLFWARYDRVPLPPLLKRADVQVFEDAFVGQIQWRPWTPDDVNRAARGAVHEAAETLGWVPRREF
jgi:hypothetical protein